VFKNRDWFVLGLVGGVALLLAYWGFSRCIGVECAPEPAWKLFEKSLHLVQGRGSFSIGSDPWQLVVAQYLVPGVAVLAAAKLFLLSLRRDLRVAFARKSSNHTVVCGLSETGRHIVENLRNAGERVVAIDLDSDTPAAAACAQAGVPVLKGDATSAKVLRLAGAHRARGHVHARVALGFSIHDGTDAVARRHLGSGESAMSVLTMRSRIPAPSIALLSNSRPA